MIVIVNAIVTWLLTIADELCELAVVVLFSQVFCQRVYCHEANVAYPTLRDTLHISWRRFDALPVVGSALVKEQVLARVEAHPAQFARVRR
jgi:hypothetical protein